MTTRILNPCDDDELDEGKAALREIVDRFDNLMEDCWRKRLRHEDQRELDELHIFLADQEQDLWGTTSMLTIDRVTDMIDMPFPLLRYSIDMLPE